MSGDQEQQKQVQSTLPDLTSFQRFKPGNDLWKKSIQNRIKFGNFSTPEVLIGLVCDYFEWLVENPIQEAKLTTYEGVASLEEIPKMRAPTLAGLCAFLGIHRDTWGAWRRSDERADLTSVVEWAEQIMYEAKYTGAAAGVLNPMMIARDLGLVDHQKLDSKTTVVIDGDEAKL